jgi:hypothetical protein
MATLRKTVRVEKERNAGCRVLPAGRRLQSRASDEAMRLRLLAAEALAAAARMSDPTCKRTMLGVAECYDRLAELLEAHGTIAPPSSESDNTE